MAEKVGSVLGCVVIAMENYRRSSGTDDGNDLDSIDFDTLVSNLQVNPKLWICDLLLLLGLCCVRLEMNEVLNFLLDSFMTYLATQNSSKAKKT